MEEKKEPNIKNGQIQNGKSKPYDLDWDKIDRLLEAGCTGAEIASNFGFHPDTLYRHSKIDKKKHFTDYAREKREKGNTLLRSAQFKNAMKGNTVMQIWLGKQRLDQTEKTQISGDSKNPLAFLLVDVDGKTKDLIPPEDE